MKELKSMRSEEVLAVAREARVKGDSETLFSLLEQAHQDIAALIRMQGIYAGMIDTKPIATGDMETVKEIAMEAMSMAKMVLQSERRAP